MSCPEMISGGRRRSVEAGRLGVQSPAWVVV